MRKLFVLLAVTLLFGTFATAQVAFTTATAAPQTIVVNATIQPSASLALSGNVINFDVQNPTVPTVGNSINVTGTVNMHKGGNAFFALDCTDLVGKEAGNVIPSTFILMTTAHGATDSPLVPFGNYWYTSPAATNGSIGEQMVEPLSFKLAPVPNFMPDQYTGTMTVTLQVI
jgi:hypothetical protein